MFLRNRSERGAAAVEFALILPILVLLLGGIVDYGRYFFTQIQLTNSAREGARAGVARSDPVARAEAAVGKTATSPATVQGWQTPSFVGNCTTAPTGNVTTTTSATFRYFFVGFLPGVPATTTITANSTMGCV